MNSRFRNFFLAFGVVAVVIMLFTFDVSYQELYENIKRAGLYLPLILVLWLVIYLINTSSWYIILRSGGPISTLSFSRLFKFTVSGFAINYVTPVGLMGGEPYRIMELKPYVGVERATSSVVLYVMMHIFSHFVFWIAAVILYVACYKVSFEIGIALGLVTLLCMFLIVVFMIGSKTGMVGVSLIIGSHLSFLMKHSITCHDDNTDMLRYLYLR